MCFEARAISAAAVLSPTERPMRVAVIVVGLVVVSTPSQASKSCMTQAEARQQFATSHLYWHGRHCWDAMTSSRRVVHRVGENVQREAQRDPAAEPNNPEPKWREAMSEMLTVNEAPSPSMNWENRWVEIAQAPPTLAGDKAAQEDASANAGHRIEPMFTPMRVLLAFLDLVLTLAHGLVDRTAEQGSDERDWIQGQIEET